MWPVCPKSILDNFNCLIQVERDRQRGSSSSLNESNHLEFGSFRIGRFKKAVV